MTLYEFNALPIDHRADHLWEHGTFLAATDHPEGRSAWYTLHGYYVEVVMREGDFTEAVIRAEPMRIAEVTPFTTGPRLERLASIVNLDGLSHGR